MSECRYIEADAAVGITPNFPDIRPGEARPIGHDLSMDADCQRDGVTVVSVTWTVTPAGAGLTLSQDSESGLTVQTLATADPGITERAEFLVNASITLSDNQKLERPGVQAVEPWS